MKTARLKKVKRLSQKGRTHHWNVYKMLRGMTGEVRKIVGSWKTPEALTASVIYFLSRVWVQGCSLSLYVCVKFSK